MKYSKLQAENQFDTLRLQVPADIMPEPNWNNFTYSDTFISATGDMEKKATDVHTLKTKHKGITCWYVDKKTPLEKPKFDMIISAKVLKDEYYKGISRDTIKRLGLELQASGITDDEIDMSEFLQHSQVLRADNTFNIKVDEPDIQTYYDSLDIVISQGKRGKIQTYEQEGSCNGIVIGKDTKVVQKITIYNKLDEARQLLKEKYPYHRIDDSAELEYGMKWADFHTYFADKLRVELRIMDWDKLRKFYTNRKSGIVTLEDLIFSENNAILYQWRQFVNEGHTKEALNFLDMSFTEKRNYKTNSYSAAANWALLKQFVKVFDGNEKKVTEKIQKIYYVDPKTTKYKKISPSVRKDITRFCAEWRENKLKSKRGELFKSNLTGKYQEIDKKISNL